MPVTFFQTSNNAYAVQSATTLGESDIGRLEWLLQAERSSLQSLDGTYLGPRREMVSPWSSNACDIVRNVGLTGIERIEEFFVADAKTAFDPMLQELFSNVGQDVFRITAERADVCAVDDIEGFNREAGLAMSSDEIEYLRKLRAELGRSLTDSEVFGFAQVNSEHCRHKIFNGKFIIDGVEQNDSLFALIKKTTANAPERIVSAYSDNVAFFRGPKIEQFAPVRPFQSDFFELQPRDTVLSLKAETHNFPTTVEPFYGASTGSGGEIRDRMAGGRGSLPLAGAAVYMSAYSRLDPSQLKPWEAAHPARDWKYQSPEEILIKASNGASDFGNKFGQPLIVGSVFTFEGYINVRGVRQLFAYDRAVMLAGGVGYADRTQAIKSEAAVNDILVLLGGDNYRIGMAGGSVSSIDTGKSARAIELSAVQRANPEMQKRVHNVIRALAEGNDNPVKLVHDHGAGGHINCFGELLDPLGGVVRLDLLPVGDPTLSAREIICNESQERMGLIVPPTSISLLAHISLRERAPAFEVGVVTGDGKFVFRDESANSKQNGDGALNVALNDEPVSLPIHALLGSTPQTVIDCRRDEFVGESEEIAIASGAEFLRALKAVFALEGVGSKDWLTNKVDRCVTGRIVQQQTVGPLQLPLSDYALTALDYTGTSGIAIALGHAAAPGLLSAAAGAELSVAEALTNIVWTVIDGGLSGVVLSANWMWPAKQGGEDARLYDAVQRLSELCRSLKIPVPTGKDSLSMTMNYSDSVSVRAPGTVIVTASAYAPDVALRVTPDLKEGSDTRLLYVDLSGDSALPLGGSALMQTLGRVGQVAPRVNGETLGSGFQIIQGLIAEGKILAGHDVSSGGVITTICEMAFGGDVGVEIDLTMPDLARFLFCEKPGVVLQLESSEFEGVRRKFEDRKLSAVDLGRVGGSSIDLVKDKLNFSVSRQELLADWTRTSHLLDRRQSKNGKAEERFANLTANKLFYTFPRTFSGRASDYQVKSAQRDRSGLTAAVIREQGTNGEREMAFSLYAAGFDVKDVTMHDLISGQEALDDVSFVVFPGGFANSDVLGAGRGWAGVFRFHDRALKALEGFYSRSDTLSLGVCNGCQLMMSLELLYPEYQKKIRMERNESEKFECGFVNVEIVESPSIMLKPLVGSRLGIWVAHGEGKFLLPEGERGYELPIRYSSANYPTNPNGSEFNVAAVVSKDGRHLAMMPHLERSAFPRQWPYYANSSSASGVADEISPWMLAFTAARDWLKQAKR